MASKYIDGEETAKTSCLLLFALATTCWAGIAFAENLRAIERLEDLGLAPDRLKRITDVYQGYVDRGELPGAVVAIARNGKLAYIDSIGYQDREKKIAMKQDAIFRIASMTKPIVSVAAMMLVEEGKLDLLTPVANILPEFKDIKVGIEEKDAATGTPKLRLDAPQRAITVQDLLRHTAGLVYGYARPLPTATSPREDPDRSQSFAASRLSLAERACRYCGNLGRPSCDGLRAESVADRPLRRRRRVPRFTWCSRIDVLRSAR